MEFTSFDGKKLFVREWLEVERPRGIVQMVHGMVEHSGRYDPLGVYLNAHGYIAFADDHRGHGETDKTSLGYCPGDMFQDTVRDLAKLTEHYKQRFPGVPFFLFGHSYGSFLTQSYLGTYGGQLSGAVIAGSNRMDGAQVTLGLLTARAANALGQQKKPGKFIENISFGGYAKMFDDGQWVSHDPENNRRYHADPYCSFTCSYRFYEDFFKGLGTLYTPQMRDAIPKDLPLFLIAGQEDPVGDMGKGMERLLDFYKNEVGVKDVSLRLIPGFRHEFVGVEQDREANFGAVLAFLDRIAGKV